ALVSNSSLAGIKYRHCEEFIRNIPLLEVSNSEAIF
ncbi:MAG: hypothetical protein ACI8SN_002728, partial [Algoriphagus sp.]